ncbi:hypothetical protein ACFLYN_04830 [Chloroflexota bacterium]
MTDNNKHNPYLTAVIYTRNDGYGGRRHEVGIIGLLEQAEKHHLRLELILVEWNPPPDKPLFKDVFPWPQNLSYSTIRSIVVPPAIHERYEYSDKYPIHGTVTFNTGIRRARGEFVLSTTPDMLFSDEIMEYLASEKLDRDSMYGINIHHVKGDVIMRKTLEEQLRYSKGAVRGVSDIGEIDFGSKENPVLQREGPGDFILLPKERWDLIRGYPEIDVVGANCGDLVVYMTYLSGAKDVVLREPMRVYHMDHDTPRETAGKIIKFVEAVYVKYNLGKRLGRISNIIGSVFYKVFPKKNILEEKGVIFLSTEQYRKMVTEMIQGKRSYVYNDENWGLGQESLEDYTINTADWDKDYEQN